MINIIKTAIITIVISFISGLLLEHYKNLAPRILCNIGKGVPLQLNNKKICTYTLTVRNLSNKTIHELSLNIQGSQNNLKTGDSKITKGLKFDSSMKDNILDVYIPFLSKDDEFSVILYVENESEVYNKPIITIRSPENFKEVDSVEQNGILSLLLNISKNINKIDPNKKGDFTTNMNNAPDFKKTINKGNKKILHRSKKYGINKKAMIIIGSIILIMTIGVLGKFYFQETSANTQAPSAETDVQKQSNDETESAAGTTKNKGVKSSTGEATKNTGAKTSTDGTTGNTDTKTSTSGTNENTDTNTSISGTTGNTDTNTSTGKATENTDTKTPTGGATGSTDTKASTGGTSGSTDTKTSASGATKNTDTKASTDGTTKNTNTNTSTGGTTGNTSN